MRTRRARRRMGESSPKAPLNDVIFITDIVKTMREGGAKEKLEALGRLASRLEEGTAPTREAAWVLEEALGDADLQVKRTALLTLAKHGSALLDGLRGGLSNASPAIRRTSAKMIRRVLAGNPGLFRVSPGGQSDRGGRCMARSLFAALSDSEEKVRGDAFMSLNQLAKRNPLMVLDERNRTPRGDDETGRRADEIGSIALATLSEQARENPC